MLAKYMEHMEHGQFAPVAPSSVPFVYAKLRTPRTLHPVRMDERSRHGPNRSVLSVLQVG